MLAPELIDHILSFCEGHVRADLHVKNVGVPLRQNMKGLVDKMLLEQTYTIGHDGSFVYFVNKLNYCNMVGYVSKMISKNEILYTWIHVNWF